LRRASQSKPISCPQAANGCTRFIIDGEAVACNGITSFDRIRYRRHDGDVFLYAFDLSAPLLIRPPTALLLQRNNKHAEAAEYWRRYLANDAQSEWAARARRSLKFCEMQMHLSAY